MARGHPIIALDRRRRRSHYANSHKAKKRFKLDIYYTALRHQERRAHLIRERQRLDSMLAHKLYRPGTEIFLTERRQALSNQIGSILGP